ncbi:hypothetical protein ABT001_24890 [Streptomyces sp. NPDC002793]|uniref:hypothetical protein n=1 Tax=Streptomyces sp. NPDC002793 TaxID=3154432 RepID=UPI00332B44B9
MRALSGRGERSGDVPWTASGSSLAGRSRAQESATRSNFADILSLQRLAGNAATAEAVAVQRASERGRHDRGYDDDLAYGSLPGGSGGSSRRREPRRSDSVDSGLAYGSDHETPPPVNTPFRGSVSGVRFASESNGAGMREVFDFVAAAAPHFSQELSAAGSITVQFGRTQGGTPGEWRAASRSITLDPRRTSIAHLAGTAVFEILNAAATRRVAALEGDVRSGRLDIEAQRVGWLPHRFFAMEVERIEWQNGMRHRQIVAGAGGAGSGADLFAAEGDFDAYYERQVSSGHTHSYEFRYSLLREEVASEARRRLETEEGGSSREDRSSSHRHQHGSRR